MALPNEQIENVILYIEKRDEKRPIVFEKDREKIVFGQILNIDICSTLRFKLT